MRKTWLLLLPLLFVVSQAHGELFSSSTNFIRSLIVASNEAVIISTFVYEGDGLAFIIRGNETFSFPFAESGISSSRINVESLAGPLQLQFQNCNVFMEYQRIQVTNIFTKFFNATNSSTLNLGVGQTVTFFRPVSWYDAGSAIPKWIATLTLSNNITAMNTYMLGRETFSGPLTVTIRPGGNIGNPLLGGAVTYVVNDEFATIPGVSAIQVPAGKAQIVIEKSQDLVNWKAVFFNTVSSDVRGFYRLKATK